MRRKWGLVFTLAVLGGAALHFLYDVWPNPLTAVLAPVNESVWESNRFKYVDELRRMGAQITVDGKVAIVEGVDHLKGAPVRALDLRAGAAMVIAGLVAEGTTVLEDIQYIERGYENIVEKLVDLGADIYRSQEPEQVIGKIG